MCSGKTIRLLARAINLQLEVNDRWDWRKKAVFFGTLDQS